jgi:hypothetical protein
MAMTHLERLRATFKTTVAALHRVAVGWTSSRPAGTRCWADDSAYGPGSSARPAW